ncbi:MAG: 2Fe-2S iron-sulfur cluster-binding protein [Micromonosporaceae bacterium]
MTSPHSGMRLEPQPGEAIDRESAFSFTWNGRSYAACRGDTIASALAAAGVRVFSRSFKYHRPRGLLTASYLDPGCLVQADDHPNVRGAHQLVEPGMAVRPQNVWPSLGFDVRAGNRLLSRFLTVGFYYKTFLRPAWLWPFYQRVLRGFAAGGLPPRPDADPAPRHGARHAHPDVLVVGGGPAGMSAALAAAAAGARVMLVEEEHALGGCLRWGGPPHLAALRKLVERIDQNPRIEVLTDSVVTGRYDDNWVAVVRRGLPYGAEQLIKARAKTLVVAPGLIERPYVVAGNDLPGVMLSTAVRRLINLYAVKPGERAVVFTANAEGDAAVADLRRAGVEVVHVEDARQGGDVIRVRGRNRVRAVEVADGRAFRCDLFVTATGWTAPTSLLNMAGDQPVYRPEAARFFPDLERLPHHVMAAGGIVGDGGLARLREHAEAVGAEAARRAAETGQRWRAVRPDPESARPIPELPIEPHPELFRGRTHGFVDFSEDVLSKDLFAAVAEGYDSVELAKRYSTATMGPAQGKLETVNTVAIVAEATGRSITDTGVTTWRPPYAPITLAALAGQEMEPTRLSPMHDWHIRRGAQPLVAGAWIRPDHYGDPAAEARNVRTNVGIIDVTPIGKLQLHGPDVPELLNLLYVNKWSKLDVGQVRYGAMCGEDGVVFDDGVTGRLSEHRYLMSTTSSGAAAVWEWVENWLQTEHPDWRVHVTPVTTAYASVNVAGPRSRELMARLVEGIDLSPEDFGYMRVRVGRVAGVDDCVLWRIGFTGELSYELHIPASYGLHVWSALLEHGRDLGAAPFGVEAQRILRLEKGHLIVGQDTDGLTQAYGAGLDWAVKLDKPDFVGKPELAWQHQRGDGWRLVALQPVDGSRAPAEASQIVDQRGQIVGMVTSSRMSPTLGRAICLARLDRELTTPGAAVTVLQPDGVRAPALVLPHLAHVDPEGRRARA